MEEILSDPTANQNAHFLGYRTKHNIFLQKETKEIDSAFYFSPTDSKLHVPDLSDSFYNAERELSSLYTKQVVSQIGKETCSTEINRWWIIPC